MKELNETQARQGVTGHKVRYVLAISLVLAVIVLSIVVIIAV